MWYHFSLLVAGVFAFVTTVQVMISAHICAVSLIMICSVPNSVSNFSLNAIKLI